MPPKVRLLLVLLAGAPALCGCVVGAVANTAVGVTGAAVGTAAKVTTTAVGATADVAGAAVHTVTGNGARKTQSQP